MSGEINWGPEIAVEGKRPEWLGDGVQPLMVHNSLGWHSWSSAEVDPKAVAWAFQNGSMNVDMIRLPADHPHYATQNARTAPSGGEVGPEVVERMIAAVRDMAARDNADGTVSLFKIRDAVTEAMEIVALLPEPVDPDEAEAEAIWRSIGYASLNEASDIRKVAVACLKRGRALEKEAGR